MAGLTFARWARGGGGDEKKTAGGWRGGIRGFFLFEVGGVFVFVFEVVGVDVGHGGFGGGRPPFSRCATASPQRGEAGRIWGEYAEEGDAGFDGDVAGVFGAGEFGY